MNLALPNQNTGHGSGALFQKYRRGPRCNPRRNSILTLWA